ncbi:MAG: cob(I)yrinic acid a,c-diamide adenosyltransferase [Betaproteobacteria bacterium]|nr:cob(I)yrinic acid a,c-diamide adenosyltransferase [Betaproteobacteria bacterium]
MGHRLTRIYTRTGDDGSTGLGDGSRIPKDHLRVEAMGDVDELNSMLGLLLTETLPDETRALLVRIQHDLFDLGAELCIPGHRVIPDSRAGELEQAIDRFNETLPPLKEFILPGGSRSAALCHLARALCRRAERRLVTLHGSEPLAPAVMRYLNRLSDLLFVAARHLNRHSGGSDVLWQSNYK